MEIALLLIAVLVGPHVWSSSLALRTDTWYGTISPQEVKFTAAGYWYGFVSVPIFQFILLRWYYRILIWFRFLFQVSHLDLNLIALHPDRCCGLGFLGNVVASFAPILMAHSGLFTGYIANRIPHEGAKLPDFRFELIGIAAVLLTIVLGPLCGKHWFKSESYASSRPGSAHRFILLKRPADSTPWTTAFVPSGLSANRPVAVRTHSAFRLYPNPIIHGIANPLFAAKYRSVVCTVRLRFKTKRHRRDGARFL